MREMLDAFARAAGYCLHPRVILWSLLPFALAGGLTWLLGWLYWESALDTVRAALERWALVDAMLRWVEAFVGPQLRSLIVPIIVVALAMPVIALMSLLLVAMLMTPALVSLVASRRFPGLQALRGASWWASAAWAVVASVVALVVLVLSMPLWLIPPLAFLLPPMVWGWLTYRVMSFDVLAQHASRQERRSLMRAHRWPLRGIGLACSFMGAAPSLLWAAGAASLILAPVLAVVAVWLYTLVFAFSSLWFAHFCLAALDRMRAITPSTPDVAAPPGVQTLQAP